MIHMEVLLKLSLSNSLSKCFRASDLGLQTCWGMCHPELLMYGQTLGLMWFEPEDKKEVKVLV